MARMTGTEILALARIHAQDNDSNSNFAVSAADALVLLNAVLAEWGQNFNSVPKYVGASTTGLSFAAGDSSKETDGDPTFEEVASFHATGSSTLSYPLSPALERVTVDVIQQMLAYDGDNALTQNSADWTHVAMERVQESSDEASAAQKWRVWVYPVLNRARHLTVKAIPVNTISAITKYPDITEGDGRIIARLLAWEIARLKKESTQAFLDGILAPVPKDVLQRMYRGGVLGAQKPSQVLWRDWN